MEKILFITDTYYPDSGATTTLLRRSAEELAKRGYRVDAYPAEISGNHFSYPSEYNGVKIIKTKIEPRRNVCFEQCRSVLRSLENVLDAGNYDCVFSGAVSFEINLLTHQALLGGGVIDGFRCPMIPMPLIPT